MEELQKLQKYIMKKIERHNEEISKLTALFIVVSKVKEAGEELDEGPFSDSDTDSDTSDACSLKSCDIALVDND